MLRALRRQVRHRHLGLYAHPRLQRPLLLLSVVADRAPNASSKPGSAPGLKRGASALRSLRCMDLQVSGVLLQRTPRWKGLHRSPPGRTLRRHCFDKCRKPSRKSVTIGVCLPRVPSTKPAGCKAAGYAYSRRASNTRYLTCLLAISTSHSRSPGVSVEKHLRL